MEIDGKEPTMLNVTEPVINGMGIEKTGRKLPTMKTSVRRLKR